MTLLCWPDDESARRQLAAARLPRLLLIGRGREPPVVDDELEDWVRFPLDADELELRTAVLLDRAREVPARPWGLRLDADGVLHREDRWVAVPPIEERVLARLLDHPGHVVHRDELVYAAWPETLPADGRAVDGVLKRLRRRVAPLGVRIDTVGRVGYLLDYARDDSGWAAT
ncbi:MAG TPA: winged helix-turn-helix domain-containing protein [Acidimicrobiales bacterium]